MQKAATKTKPVEMRPIGEFYGIWEIHHLYIHGKTDELPYILNDYKSYNRELWALMDAYPGPAVMKQFLSLDMKDIDIDFYIIFNTKIKFRYAKVAYVTFIIIDKKPIFNFQLQLALRKMAFNPIIYKDSITKQLKDVETDEEADEFVYADIPVQGKGKLQHLFDTACSKLNNVLERAEKHAVKFMKTYKPR
jgi:hypothetical protein